MLRVLAVVLLLIPQLARSETVKVLSGEHADFSRLVFQFEDATNWEVGRWDRGYELRIDRADVLFDVSSVFNLIPRQRISAFVDSANGLRLVVNEGFHADAFEIRRNRLVLDIKDGAPPQGAPFEGVLDEAETANLPQAPVSRPQLPEQKKQFPNPPVQLPLVQSAQVHQNAPDFPIEIVEEPAVSDSARAFEQNLIEQLSRAASQGLLEANLPTTDELPELPTQAEPEPQPEPDEAASNQPHEKTHVKVRTRVDIDAQSARGSKPTTTFGKTCLPNAKFAINEWGGEGSGFDVPSLRSALLGEFDEVEPMTVRDLARHYIYLSFGAEAKAVMRDLGVIVPDADILMAMANVMDNQPAVPGRIAGQESCDGDVAMWAVLVWDNEAALEEINEEAVKTAFSTLPVRLRKHLGPQLSAKLVELQEVELALAVRSAISRIPGDTDASFDLLDARIELALGNEDQAWQALEGVSDEGRSLSAEATLELLNSKIDAAAFVEGKRIADAESYAFERRGTDMGHALAAAAIHATISNGSPGDALKKLDETSSAMPLSEEDTVRLTDLAYDGLVAVAEDIVFLEHTVGPAMRKKLAKVNKEIRTKVASRLVDLGFPDEARAVLDLNTDVPMDYERLVLARAALAAGDVQIAMGYVAGLTGADADRLRADALAEIRNHADAARLYSELGLNPDALREAWLAQDWLRVTELGAGSQQEIAALLSAEVKTPDDTPLESHRALIKRSARMRDLFDTLTQ